MKSKIVLTTIALLSLCSFAAAQNSSTQKAVTPPLTEPLKTGEMAPDFTLEDFRIENDQPRKATLSSSRGQGPVVLVFYRGYW